MFPRALAIALPCALISSVFGYSVELWSSGTLDARDNSILNNNGAWSGFCFLVGFLIVFRTSQAHSRFWDGCIFTHQMRAEWFDACSAICSFCAYSECEPDKLMNFKQLLVRLFSVLHAAALAEIEDCTKDDIDHIKAFNLPIIDIESLDPEVLRAMKESTCRVELIFFWIQQLLVQNISTGVMSIPPPILTRSFQELSNGMVAFHQALKIGTVPFPFPYAQTCDVLLLLHWLVAPLVVAQWANHPVWAGVFTFVQVFVLWALHLIAVEIENPFGSDDNDLDYFMMQNGMNAQLRMLISKEASLMPSLQTPPHECQIQRRTSRSSTFRSAWSTLEGDDDVSFSQSVRRASRPKSRRSATRSGTFISGSADKGGVPLQKTRSVSVTESRNDMAVGSDDVSLFAVAPCDRVIAVSSRTSRETASESARCEHARLSHTLISDASEEPVSGDDPKQRQYNDEEAMFVSSRNAKVNGLQLSDACPALPHQPQSWSQDGPDVSPC